MLEGRQEKIFNAAYDAYNELLGFCIDYENQIIKPQGLDNLSLAAIFDLQLQKKLVEITSSYEDELSGSEMFFVEHIINNKDELTQGVEGYRKFIKGVCRANYENISKDVTGSLEDIPYCVLLALKMDNNRHDEFTTIFFKEYMTILDCFICLERQNGEKREECIKTTYFALEEYVKSRNVNYKGIDNKSIFEKFWYLKEEKKPEQEREKNLEDLIKELNEMIGLDGVKANVQEMLELLKVRKERERRGMENSDMSLHMVFTGNPGTGKTTVARLLAQIYKKMGILAKGQLVEADRSKLVGAYIGQSERNTKEILNQAMGGILFIDEAYALSDTESSNDYGREVINILLKSMEDNRDKLIVIVAGYTGKMDKFLSSNPGLKSRFNTFIHFEDYTPEEMLKIFNYTCKKAGFIPTPSCKDAAKEKINRYCAQKTDRFANGRDVRNLYEKIVRNQHKRIAGMYSDLSEVSETELNQIIGEDLTDVEF
ncbi:AAA family ATPase [Butyrivibrio sp. YAB3001]|uniref:AAA family ATPase n=1 Tax=Butyrivibrio sp. YAB3001 TaxID=1520812 RepID=UPI0008F62107|nr:AAA family ATPase [Butyrivibrio sp. YAB3001]SFB81637.1 ATPase family associated with various cellular activities (AAA) [Butyrivibrio sp. YAB3001]